MKRCIRRGQLFDNSISIILPGKLLYFQPMLLTICYAENIVVYLACDSAIFVVVGEAEKKAGTVNVRTRDNKVHGERAIDEVMSRFKELSDSRELEAEEKF